MSQCRCRLPLQACLPVELVGLAASARRVHPAASGCFSMLRFFTFFCFFPLSSLFPFRTPFQTYLNRFSDVSASLLLRITVPKSEENTEQERRRNEQNPVREGADGGSARLAGGLHFCKTFRCMLQDCTKICYICLHEHKQGIDGDKAGNRFSQRLHILRLLCSPTFLKNVNRWTLKMIQRFLMR